MDLIYKIRKKIAYTKFMAFAPLLRWRCGKFIYIPDDAAKLVLLTYTQLLSITPKMKAVYHQRADLKWCSKRISHGLEMDYCRTSFHMNQICKVYVCVFFCRKYTYAYLRIIAFSSFIIFIIKHFLFYFLFVCV